jgi:hypothetical protein
MKASFTIRDKPESGSSGSGMAFARAPARLVTGERVMIHRFVTIAVLMLTAACAPQVDRPTREDLEGRVSALEHQLEEAREKAEAVETAATELESAAGDLDADVGRFTSENWREIVPAVRGDADDVEAAHEAIQTASAQMTEAVAEQ